MAMGQLVKAFILNEDNPAERVECLFNPPDYTFSKVNQWQTQPIGGSNVPQTSFQGGGVMTMKFQLFFDTYRESDLTDVDVRQYTEKLLKLMQIDPRTQQQDSTAQTGRPPVVSFHWGDYWSFKGVFTSINLKFTLFTGTGKPVRATADVELQQVEQEGTYPRQNPTSGGDGTRAGRVVQAGDTLDLIAYQEYGDAALWRPIATANSLDNPRTLFPGQRLVIPAL